MGYTTLNQLQIDIIHARFPWSVGDKNKGYEPALSDTKDMVDKCINCTKPDCDNCFGNAICQGNIKIDLNRFVELLHSDMTIKEICSLLNISRSSFYNYKTYFMKGMIV